MDSLLIGQIIGVFAFLVTAFGFLQHNERKMKIILTVATFIWVAHFYFLQRYTASAVVFSIAIRQFTSTYFDHASYSLKLKLAIIFGIIHSIVAIITWSSLISILPLIAALSATVGMFLLKGKKMRTAMLLAEISWFIHNIIVVSWGGLAANITNSSILIYHIFFKKHVDTEPLTDIEKATTQSAI